MQTTTLNEIENEYRKKIQSVLETKDLSASLLLDLSVELFCEIKVQGISHDDIYSDALLYQYGIYDSVDYNFRLDITRQFMSPPEHEPYQLNFILRYDPEAFKGLGFEECWSMDFTDLESFIEHIKSTEGFKLAEKLKPKDYKIVFSQC